MKKLLFVLAFTFIGGQAFSQELPVSEKTGKVSYENVITVEGSTSSDLYISANEWFATTFNSANDVIQMQDKEAGKLIGRGVIQARLKQYGSLKYSGLWNYTLSITTREGRYKYSLTNISHSGRDGIQNTMPNCGVIESNKSACNLYYTKKKWKEEKARLNNEIISIVNSLLEYMSETNLENDSW